LLSAGDLAASIELLERALKLNAGDNAARLRLAVACAELGRHERADAEFAELIRRLRAGGDNSDLLHEAHCHAAAHCRATGRVEEAIAHYRSAIAARPTDVEARLLLALLHGSRGELAAAEAALRQSLRIAPDHGPAHVWLGKVLDDSGRGGEARAEFRAALRTRPALRADWLLVARRVLPYPELAGELRAFLLAYSRRFPDSPDGPVLLAKLCLARGDTAGAVAALRRAQRLDPDIPWIAGKIAELQGRPAGTP
jgi:tetratricopeptide (TPR) repeat protein